MIADNYKSERLRGMEGGEGLLVISVIADANNG